LWCDLRQLFVTKFVMLLQSLHAVAALYGHTVADGSMAKALAVTIEESQSTVNYIPRAVLVVINRFWVRSISSTTYTSFAPSARTKRSWPHKDSRSHTTGI
jgi:hypothetical protein